MATENAQEDSVLIRLSVLQPGNLDHPERRILLTDSKPIADLGRSSSRPSLGLQPAVTNGWYNSPVMSRHHAQLEADFTRETVGIRDSGSMHGTFLNKNKVGSHMPQPTRIRVGDELTLGLPVFRNREEFQPALVRVDGMEFYQASRRPTTTPTRTFTVPDDCSTDDNDNEPADESFDECIAMGPGANPAVGIIDGEAENLVDSPNPWADSHPALGEDDHLQPCHFSTGLSHQLDGADDVSAPVDELPRSGFVPVSDVSSCDGSFIRDDGDKDDEDRDTNSLRDILLRDDLDMQDIDHGDESRSLSWNSFSSDSEDEHMNNDSALDETDSEGFALFEDDSDEARDEADVDGEFQPDADLDSEQKTEDNLRPPSMKTEINHTPVFPSLFPRLPPISSVISTGPNDWISRSHSNWGARSPSPSDAVLLPRHCRPDAEKIIVDNRLDVPDQIVSEDRESVTDHVAAEDAVQKPGVVNLAASGGNSTSDLAMVETACCKANPRDVGVRTEVGEVVSNAYADLRNLTLLAQKSGKTEFFAARAVNKMVHDTNKRTERLFEVSCAKPKQGNPLVPSNEEREAEMKVPLMRTPGAAGQMCGFSLAAHTHRLAGEGTSSGMVYQPEHADTQDQLLYRPESLPYSREDADAYTWPLQAEDCLPDYEQPLTAYELQCLKQQTETGMHLRSLSSAPRNVPSPSCRASMAHPKQAPTNVEAASSTDADLSTTMTYPIGQLEQEPQKLDEQEASVPLMDKQDARKGKRKATEISEEGPQEVHWVQSVSSEGKSRVASLSETLQSPSLSASRPSGDQNPMPSPPPSPEEVARPEQRPTKKIKRIAERVGYAALGGVSVGAMVLTSLIYTAPNFV